MSDEKSRAFHRLHQLLTKLQDAEELLAHGPRRIAAAEKKVAKAEQACTEQKAKIKELRRTVDQHSLDLKSKEAELQKLNVRLNEVTSNKEYSIVQTQIQAVKATNAEVEDKILELLSEVDAATVRLNELEQQLEDARKRVQEITKDVQDAEPGLTADVEQLTAEIREAEKMISGAEAVATYRRLRQSHGAGALSAVDSEGYCEECNTAATPQDIVRLNLGDFVLCRACGRILYRL